MRWRSFIKIILIIAICLSGGSVFSFYSLLYDQNDVTEPTLILVQKGEPLVKIAQRLKKEGLLQSIAVFKVAGRLSGKATQLKAGEYSIPPRASAKEILDILVSGQTVLRRVTIPEGRTSQQIFDLLMQTPGLFGELKNPPPNGALLPETYTFSYGLPRQVIIDRMSEAMIKTIEELWPYRYDDLPYTTKEEALVLASIVEKETSIPAERARVAAVFVNRLHKGMRLQTDPTVIYAVTEGTMELGRRLTFKDLKHQHPYNTYVNKGLPPSPICNPGRDSIQAVLQPLKTDEIYFVADGTGGHTFARTFDQHKRNIAEWKKVRARKRQGGRKQAAAKTTPAKTPAANKAIEETVLPTEAVVDQVIEKQDGKPLIDVEDIAADIVDDILEENKKNEIQSRQGTQKTKPAVKSTKTSVKKSTKQQPAKKAPIPQKGKK